MAGIILADSERAFCAGADLQEYIDATVQEIIGRHTEQQFADEERWMQETGFPMFGFHADEHAAVLASMSCVSRKIAAGDTSAARVFARALTEWFPGHAHHLDCALARWICNRGLGENP